MQIFSVKRNLVKGFFFGKKNKVSSGATLSDIFRKRLGNFFVILEIPFSKLQRSFIVLFSFLIRWFELLCLKQFFSILFQYFISEAGEIFFDGCSPFTELQSAVLSHKSSLYLKINIYNVKTWTNATCLRYSSGWRQLNPICGFSKTTKRK